MRRAPGHQTWGLSISPNTAAQTQHEGDSEVGPQSCQEPEHRVMGQLEHSSAALGQPAQRTHHSALGPQLGVAIEASVVSGATAHVMVRRVFKLSFTSVSSAQSTTRADGVNAHVGESDSRQGCAGRANVTPGCHEARTCQSAATTRTPDEHGIHQLRRAGVQQQPTSELAANLQA